MSVHRAGTWTRADQRDAPHREVAVDVPAGVDWLRVELRYDRDRAVLDLGLVDPGGFRGYSGGARTEAVVGRHRATPGYLPGAPQEGTWSVLLGLYRIPREGVSWEVEVETGRGEPPLPPPPPWPALPARVPRRALPAEPGVRWVATDLHSHSVHSDGTLTVPELAARARAAGLDLLAVTDHNTIAHHAELAEVAAWSEVELLPGQEVTTRGGHANVLGAAPWVDFRAPAHEWRAAADAAGALFEICHPVAGDLGWRHPVPGPPDLVEVWHATWWGDPARAVAFWQTHGGRLVGGSDFHTSGGVSPLGWPTTWVACREEGADVLEALRAGPTAVSASPDGPVVLRVGDEVAVVAGEGTVLVDGDGRRTRIGARTSRLPDAPGPLWLVEPAEGLPLALSA